MYYSIQSLKNAVTIFHHMSEVAAGCRGVYYAFLCHFHRDQKAFLLAVLCQIGSYWLSCARLACDWS